MGTTVARPCGAATSLCANAQRTLTRRQWFRDGLVAAVIAAALVAPAAADDRDREKSSWVGSWGASPQQPVPFFTTVPIDFNNQTVRQIVRISTGGSKVRIRLSNLYGAQPVTIGNAHVALSAGGAAINPPTDRAVTFSGGHPSVIIPPGALVLSDPVDLKVPALASLAISLYLPQSTGPATWHLEGKQTAYIVSGNATNATDVSSGATTSTARFFLAGVETASRECRSAIVTFGDSITDGTQSTVDTNHRWPDRLAERLNSRGDQRGVVNEGISGNRILHDTAGPNALSRFDRDVLATPGVRFMTVLLGINDIGFGGFIPTEAVTPDDIIAGHRQMIARARSRGIRIYGATLTPFNNAGAPYFSAAHEADRQAVNAWIRGSGEYDAVIDFDKVVRDPADPTKLLAAYDSGDHLHPNDAGYKAMADSIDLRLFRTDDDDCRD
jgi:lysophospholipase L1-like esterase